MKGRHREDRAAVVVLVGLALFMALWGDLAAALVAVGCAWFVWRFA